MSLQLVDGKPYPGRQIFVPYNAKLADITHADTNLHVVNLATALSETRKIIAVLVNYRRMGGTGSIYIYPNEGTFTQYAGTWGDSNSYITFVVIKDGTNELQYSLSVAGDDYDMWCLGYVVEI